MAFQAFSEWLYAAPAAPVAEKLLTPESPILKALVEYVSPIAAAVESVVGQNVYSRVLAGAGVLIVVLFAVMTAFELASRATKLVWAVCSTVLKSAFYFLLVRVGVQLCSLFVTDETLRAQLQAVVSTVQNYTLSPTAFPLPFVPDLTKKEL